jgi:RNA polymerase sigma factor (sigma-70 family)
MSVDVRQNHNSNATDVEGMTTDGQLLESFAERRDEVAFAKLMEIHGPMVHGVCSRILGNHHDAEDACQASFLVLAHKARSIASRASIASWLYGVARRTALKAKCARAKRQRMESQVITNTQPNSLPRDCWADIGPCVDLELSRLPEKYREALILCDLEGQSQLQAARQLHTTEGAISMRLTRARRILAGRLSRYGFALSATTIATLLSQNGNSIWASMTLVASTSKAAAMISAGQATTTAAVSADVTSLVQGVLKSMLLNNVFKAMLAAVLLAGIGLGTGGLVHRMQAAESAKEKSADARKDTPQATSNQDENLKKELEKLQGQWVLVAEESAGNKVPDQRVKDNKGKLKISGARFTLETEIQKNETVTIEGALRLDLTQHPALMDWHSLKSDKDLGIQGPKIPEFWGIYKVDGDSFTYCCVEENKERPGEFKTKKDLKLAQRMWTFKRAKR